MPFFKNVQYLGLDGHLDYVLSFQVLEHVSDPKTLIDEFNRILKPNGTLLISVPFLYDYHACRNDF